MALSDRDDIRQFVLRHTDGVDVDDDEDLFDAGFANSLFTVQLVMWLERTFGRPVQLSVSSRDDFRSISSISAFVEGNRPPRDGNGSAMVRGQARTSN
jgi:methoxymalonate biosynthesis acyl carrier protein